MSRTITTALRREEAKGNLLCGAAADKIAALLAANDRVGSWLAAALEDRSVCEAMKADVRAWFDAQPKDLD